MVLSNNHITNAFGSFLEEVGVYFVEGYDAVEVEALIQSSCVTYPDSDTVLTRLGTLNEKIVLDSFRHKNGALNEEMLQLIVNNYNGTMPNILRRLPLLQTTGKRYVLSLIHI